MFRRSRFHSWIIILQVNRFLTDHSWKVSDLLLCSLHYQDACKPDWNSWCKQSWQSRDVSIHSRCCCIGCKITWFGGMLNLNISLLFKALTINLYLINFRGMHLLVFFLSLQPLSEDLECVPCFYSVEDLLLSKAFWEKNYYNHSDFILLRRFI